MPHTLLLADDSVTIQRVIELTFADEDITVVAVSDGDQAIARIDAEPPDIVLADIGMPGRNGYEVAQYIKRSPKLSKIPVVLLTGAFEPVDQARADEAGCDGILAKPFEPQLVISRVKELLSAGGSTKKASPEAAPPIAATAPAHAEPAAPPPKLSGRSADTREYFDRLDAAFTHASAAPPSALVAASNLPNPRERSAPVAEDVSSDAQTVMMPPVQEAPTVAIPVAAPAKTMEPNEQGSQGENDVTRAVMMAGASPRMPAQPAPMPSLADAFATLLAAEQTEPLPPSVPTWPASGPPGDAIAEQVFRRVIDQMSDRVVREAVKSVVAEIAERLVREEIEKIRASVK